MSMYSNDPETVDEIVEMYSNSIPVDEISQELNIPPSMVYSILRTTQTILSTKNARDRAAVRLYKATYDQPSDHPDYRQGEYKYTVYQICHTLGISAPTLYTILAVNNVPLRNDTTHKPTSKQEQAIIDAYTEGTTVQAIKKRFKLSSNQLYIILHKYNTPLRRR